MKIIVDMMGGDNAPKEILLGAAAAVREYGVQITAVGRRRDIEACARENGIDMAGIPWPTPPRPLRCAMSPQGPSAARRIPPSWWA